MIAAHVLVCALIVLFVLLQSGKGGDMGATFGASTGNSNSFFGAGGAGNVLTKITSWLAVAFAVTSLSITVYQVRIARTSIFDTGVSAPVKNPAPDASTPKAEDMKPESESPPAAPKVDSKAEPQKDSAAGPKKEAAPETNK